jgi:hypothetical protein
MAAGTVRYDSEKNIVYVTVGDVHLGQEYLEFMDKWKELIETDDKRNFNTIVDLSKLDPDSYGRDPLENDPAKDHYMIERWSTRNRGEGKVLIVISQSKGNSPRFMNYFKPDAVFFSNEDAEHYIETGIIYDRT